MRRKRILAILAGGTTMMVAAATSSFAAMDVGSAEMNRDVERISSATLRVVSPGKPGIGKGEADRARKYVESGQGWARGG